MKAWVISKTVPNYTVLAEEDKTVDDIWQSEKCWFIKGDRVVISDGAGNTKEFVKE